MFDAKSSPTRAPGRWLSGGRSREAAMRYQLVRTSLWMYYLGALAPFDTKWIIPLTRNFRGLWRQQ